MRVGNVFRQSVLAIYFVIGSSGAVWSQNVPDTVRLEEVVVTATRVPTPRASIAAAVTVISGEELRSRGVRYVLDALRTALGTSIAQVGSFGGITSLFLRGGESDYVSVLLDGIPLNQPGGAIDLADLTTDNVDRIEIVRGPASVLYGSDAMTGVVQIFTLPASGATRTEVGIRGGLFSSARWDRDRLVRGEDTNAAWEWYWRWTAGSDQVRYSFGASRIASEGLYTTDGIEGFKNDYRNTAISGAMSAALGARSEATLTLHYGDNRYYFPTDGAGRLVDHNQFTRETAATAGIEVGYFLTPRLEARLQLATHLNNAGNDDQPDSPADTLGFYAFESQATTERRRIDLRANWRWASYSVLTVGGLVEQQRERRFSTSQSQFGPSTDDTDLRRSTRAYYGQIQADLAAPLTLNVGMRLEDNQTFGTFLTARGGLVYRPDATSRLRLAAGTGFKEPTFFENFATGFVRGNPNLDPERSVSWELGLERTFLQGALRVAGTFFRQQFRDLIQFTFSPPRAGDPNWFNVAAADASGLEVEARAVLPQGMRWEMGYTYLRTRVTEAGFDLGPGAAFEAGKPLLRRPAHSGFVMLSPGDWKILRTSVISRYVGAREDLDFSRFPAERRVLDPYWTVDLVGEVRVLRLPSGWDLGLTVKGENLFDADARESFNFPARGRTLWLGARLGS